MPEQDINQEGQQAPQIVVVDNLSQAEQIAEEIIGGATPTSTTEELLGFPVVGTSSPISGSFVEEYQREYLNRDHSISVPPPYIEVHPANMPLDPMANTLLIGEDVTEAPSEVILPTEMPEDIPNTAELVDEGEEDDYESEYEDEDGNEEEEDTPSEYVDAKFNRFKGAEWFRYMGAEVLIGGAGGIGSWLAMLLARASFNVTIFDFDVIEEHNTGGQFFGRRQVGKSKVQALSDNIVQLCDEYINGYNEAYTDKSVTTNYTFSAFDNMKARKDMFEAWKKNWGADGDAIFIDGRLTFEQIQIFCVKGGDAAKIAKYETEHLFDDSLVEDGPCTMKQTSHSAAMIAAMMVGLFTNYLSRKAGKPCAVPFFTEYFMPLCTSNKEM